jgi:hypothetical protein
MKLDDSRAHITITKQKKQLSWSRRHFTVDVAAKGRHIFYDVNDDGTFILTGKMYDREGKNKNASEHGKDGINDSALKDDIEGDMRLIFRYLARG